MAHTGPAWKTIGPVRIGENAPGRTSRRAARHAILLPAVLTLAACGQPDRPVEGQEPGQAFLHRTPRATTHGTKDTTADVAAPATIAQALHIRSVVAAGGVVDSLLPAIEQLRRFRQHLPTLDTLQHASPSLEALVARLSRALGASDTSALGDMVLNRREFAYLYYPASPLSRPPYSAPPELLWEQIRASSGKGAGRLMQRFGGQTVGVEGLRCASPPDTMGGSLLHSRCTVRFTTPGTTAFEGRLFGSVIELEGRFKFIGLSSH